VADAPAKLPLISRRTFFVLAWFLFAVSLLQPTPSELPGAYTLGGSALYVYGKALQWSAALPPSDAALTTAQTGVLALALFSHIAFLYTIYLRNDCGIAVAWKGILLASLAIDASVGVLVPDLAKLPAYWVWLASIASLAVAYVIFGDAGAAAAKSHGSSSVIDSGGVPPFVWTLLAFTLFWVVVSASNRAASTQSGDATAIRDPLTGYVNDRAHVLTADEVSLLSFALQNFELTTPSQIAVAIFPSAPADQSIDEFAIRTAERLPLGRAGLDTGAILLVFMKERAARLEIGYGLEGIVPDVDAHRILESNLATAFSRGAYFDGISTTLKAIFAPVKDAYAQDRLPGKLTVWKRQLTTDRPNLIRRIWRTISETGLLARIGATLLCAIVGLALLRTAPQWARLLRDVWRGVQNVMARQPFMAGMESVEGGTLVDSVRLLVWTLGILIPAAGVLIIAGGGTFGGAGALIHW
jgi:uncharacterized membrane protein YgcG